MALQKPNNTAVTDIAIGATHSRMRSSIMEQVLREALIKPCSPAAQPGYEAFKKEVIISNTPSELLQCPTKSIYR